jgi:ketosteroid isomerase-like protein
LSTLAVAVNGLQGFICYECLLSRVIAMNCCRLLPLGLLFWSVPVGLVQEVQQDKKAIQAVLQDQAAAWNKGDLAGFMKGYWESDQLTFFSGNSKTSGWKATLGRYQKKYQGEGKEMGQLSFTELSVEMLGADHALVRGRFTLKLNKDMPTGIFTLILKRTAAGWRIVHDHTSS